jgi:hypothetical protein
MEPACKPSGKPMRNEHDWDEEIGVCKACGAKGTTFAPRPAPAAPLPKARPGKGARHKPSPAHRAAFAGQMLTPAPPREEVATIPDPLVAALAALELERDEIDIAIATLRRLQGRKATA